MDVLGVVVDDTSGVASVLLTLFSLLIAASLLVWAALRLRQQQARSAELEQRLAAAERRVRIADGGRGVFLANLSHEIRTPINAMLGYAQLLRRDPGLREEQRRYCEAIYRQGLRLVALIDDVLAMATLGSGSFSARSVTFDPQTVLKDLYELFAEDAANKGRGFSAVGGRDLPMALVGDVDRLRQVCTGLCVSALNRPGGGEVEIRFELHDGSNGTHLRVRITDQAEAVDDIGHGMEWDVLLAALMAKNQGIDLGLAIARETVRQLGGRMTLSRPEEGGTVVEVELPVGIGERGTSTRIRRQSSLILDRLQASPRVLVVDDHGDNREILSALLTDVGFTVREAAGGQQALHLFSAWRPEIVLMDLLMPDMSGGEAIAAIRALPGGDAAKILLVTAHQTGAATVPADAVIRKPVIEEELLLAIQRLAKVQYKAVGVRSVTEDGRGRGERRATPVCEPVEPEPVIGGSVLVVDDEDVNREVLGLLFAELGVGICVADGGAAALASFRDHKPRLVLTDLRMPGMDGFALARAIRAEAAGREVVILALSGAVSQDLAEDPCEAGFDGVLSKPVRLHDLKEVLRRFHLLATGPE
jgi:CheY-like chemotaxis protein/signal transduction histidine kinase